MQFKRWAARTGKVAEFLQNQQNQPVLQNEAGELETDQDSTVESDDEEINTNLIAWLEQWQMKEDLRVRGKFLESTA